MSMYLSLTGKILVLAIRDVGPGAEIPELLRKTKVDHVQLVAVTTDTHKEIIRLDVTVDEAFAVDELHAAQHLV